MNACRPLLISVLMNWFCAEALQPSVKLTGQHLQRVCVLSLHLHTLIPLMCRTVCVAEDTEHRLPPEKVGSSTLIHEIDFKSKNLAEP